MKITKETLQEIIREELESLNERTRQLPRQLKDKKKEMMVVKNGKVQVIDKKDWKKYKRKGYLVAENDLVNEEDRFLNKKVKKYLDTYLKGVKKNSPEHQHSIMLIMKGALTDANYHSWAKQLDKFFPKAKQSKYVDTEMEDVIEDKGIDIARWAEWDGYDIVDAFSFYTSMTLSGGFGQKLKNLKESVNEAKKFTVKKLGDDYYPYGLYYNNKLVSGLKSNSKKEVEKSIKSISKVMGIKETNVNEETLQESPTRRSNDFFNNSKHGKAIYKLLRGKPFNDSKVRNYLDTIRDKLGYPKGIRAWDFIGKDLGLNIRKYDNLPVYKYQRVLVRAIDDLYHTHIEESVNEVSDIKSGAVKMNSLVKDLEKELPKRISGNKKGILPPLGYDEPNYINFPEHIAMILKDKGISIEVGEFDKLVNTVFRNLKPKLTKTPNLIPSIGNTKLVHKKHKLDESVNEANAVSGGKIHKFITGKNLTYKGKKYSDIEFELLGIDNNDKLVKLKILAPRNLFGQEMKVPFRTIRRGPFIKTDTSK